MIDNETFSRFIGFLLNEIVFHNELIEYLNILNIIFMEKWLVKNALFQAFVWCFSLIFVKLWRRISKVHLMYWWLCGYDFVDQLVEVSGCAQRIQQKPLSHCVLLVNPVSPLLHTAITASCTNQFQMNFHLSAFL